MLTYSQQTWTFGDVYNMQFQDFLSGSLIILESTKNLYMGDIFEV